MTGPVTTEALKARIAELEAENAQIAVERNEALAMRRWNIDRTGDGEVLVCRGYHDKGEDCDHERFVPEERLAADEAALQQVTAERDEEKARADRNDAKLAEITQPWVDDKGGVWLAPTAWAYAKACGALHQHRDRANVAEASLATATSELARLRAALKVFADMDAMDPPEGVPLNEWLPAVTGARAALREPPALARAATAREGDTPTTEDKGREDRA